MPPIKRLKLDEKIVIDLYQELLSASPTGKVSMTDLYNQLAERLISSQTNKPFTRQRLYALLKQSSVVKPPVTQARAIPIVCINPLYPKISQWMKELVTSAGVYHFDDLTPALCENREVYGAPSVACMYTARNVWWLFYKRSPVDKDIDPSEYGSDVYLRRIRCQLAEFLPLKS